MLKILRFIMLPLLLAMTFAVPALAGCGEQSTELTKEIGTAVGSGTFTQQELQQIITDAMSSMKNATTYTFTLEMKTSMEATGGSEPGKMVMTIKSNGATDITAKKMKMEFEMSLDENTVSQANEEVPKKISAEMYLLEDAVYMKMALPDVGEQWMKMPMSEEVRKAYNMDMVDQQFTPLESPAKVEFVKYEKVDGSDCYVVKITPNTENMKEWLEQQQMTSAAFDWNATQNIMDLFKELDYQVWITKDTKLIKKMDVSMVMEINPSQVGTTEATFEKIALDMDMTMMLNNMNKSVSIVLPDEAKKAKEMPNGL